MVILLNLVIGLCLFSQVSSAFSSGELSGNSHTQARIISAAPDKTSDPRKLVGVYIELENGWKTYWRTPGDSGMPPHFDWSGSENIEKTEILWPAPKRLPDPYGLSIGYKQNVLFPVYITPKDASRPVHLKLKLAYGICKDVCVPVETELSRQIDQTVTVSQTDADLMKHYLAQIPKSKNYHQKSDQLLPDIQKISANLEGDKPHILIEAVFPKQAEYTDLFVEVSDSFFMAAPKKIETKKTEKFQPVRTANASEPGHGQHVTFHIDLTKGDKAEKLKNKTVTFTLVSGHSQTEVTWRVK